jgi:hypothetical protein
MRYLSIAVVLIILVSACAVSQTDTTSGKTLEFMISGGPDIPYMPYPFASFWKTGYELSGGVGYSLSPGSWGYGTLYGVISFDQFPFDRDGFVSDRKINPNTLVDGGSTYAFTVMGVLKGTFAADKHAIGPYFLLGLGFMDVTTGAISISGNNVRSKETRSGPAYQVGAGVDIPAGDHVKAFVEGKFVMGFTSDPGREYFPINVGVWITP